MRTRYKWGGPVKEPLRKENYAKVKLMEENSHTVRTKLKITIFGFLV